MEEEKKQTKGPLKSLAEQLKERMKDSLPEESKKTKKTEKPKNKISADSVDKKIESESDKPIKPIKKGMSNERKNIDGKKETLIPLEEYIKCAVHLGTKVITPHMRKYVYKRRADGLAVINTTLIDEKLRSAIKILAEYNPEKIYICCKREAGWNATRKFEELTGIRAFTKKYPPGVTTNLELDDFFESDLTIICDPWIDKNALNDTARLKKPVLSLCDTNNYTTNVTHLVPCNNKSKKSVGCVLFILARGYCKAKKISFNAELEDFTGPLE